MSFVRYQCGAVAWTKQPCMHVDETVHAETRSTGVVYRFLAAADYLGTSFLYPFEYQPRGVHVVGLRSCAIILVISTTRCSFIMFIMSMGHYIRIFHQSWIHLKIGAVILRLQSIARFAETISQDRPENGLLPPRIVRQTRLWTEPWNSEWPLQ